MTSAANSAQTAQLSGSKILVTGITGQIAFPLAQHLAANNDVWGLARFTDPSSRSRVQALGITPVRCDLAAGDLSAVPDDFDYVFHLAAYQGPGNNFDLALRENAEATGFVLQHCRSARAALVMSTHSVYKPRSDPWFSYRETDPMGDVNPQHSPTYSVAKIGQEAVARFCARAFNLPVTIARMNAAYGPAGGLPALHADAIAGGSAVSTRWDPCLYAPIYQDDINAQASALIGAASTPANIVNWSGDEAVSVQQWCAYAGELLGKRAEVAVRPIDGTLRGSVADVTKRTAITGPCTIGWQEGLRRTVHARHGGNAS
ncbi:MAG: NAD(P)-dependent oxidoreductase [Actinomycetota bacterium]